MAMRRLTFDQTEALYDAALSNAFHLCRDAELLIARGSVGRARALAILGLEEAGKAILIQEAKIASHASKRAEPDLDADFWRSWNHHHPKLRAVRRFLLNEDYWFGVGPPPTHELLLGPVEDYLADIDRFAQQGNASKLLGLYVDVDKATGRPLTPDPADAEEVQELIAAADQIGWQIRLGDHIEFIARQRDDPDFDITNPYAAHSDGGALAEGKLGTQGWEAHTAKLLSLMDGFDEETDE